MAYVAWHQRKVGGAITVTPVALPPVYVPTPPIVCKITMNTSIASLYLSRL